MSNFAWTESVEELSPAALTVRAQAISPNDDGRLKWDGFFPRENVDSTDLADVTTLDYRPASDRREWDQRGRLIPIKTPNVRNVSIIPVEGYYTWGEKELQKLNERSLGNAAVIEEIMQSTVPGRIDAITRANYRRVELDAFEAWGLGQVTQRNPQNASETYVASFGFDTDRYQTAMTAWNDGSVNAYTLLIAWIKDGIDASGPIRGVISRRNFVDAVIADAPALSGVANTFTNVEARIREDLGSDFRFFVMEDTVEAFTDGGTATTATKVWPSQRIAAVPAGTVVGRTAFAPVVRAMEIARSLPQAKIDINGMTAYYEQHNNGRELTVEVQCNPLTIPDEQKLWVMNVGF
jgi:hypothetical protein